MKLVDELVEKRRTHKTKIGTGKDAKTEIKVETGPMPQVALVALDPHTGEVLALVGGRNYGMSQLDHAIAKRPDRIDLQAVRLRRCGQHRGDRTDADRQASADPDTGVVTESSGVFTPASLIDDSQVSIAIGETMSTSRATITRHSTAKSPRATRWLSR